VIKNQNFVDHYKVLGISENATTEEIRTARRRMAKKFHPDKNPDSDSAHKETVAINRAYEILSNDEKRSKYDKDRSNERRSKRGAVDTTQQREYAEARARYQESEYEARERVRKWVYESIGIRPTKKHKCYTPQGNGTKLDDLVTKIDRRLGDKVWEYRIRNYITPVSTDRMEYHIRVVCDPRKCRFRENHPDWVNGYYYGLFKTGTVEDTEYNVELAFSWLGDILEKDTYSHKISVFFGLVGGKDAPWRCYLDLSVVLIISAFDVFLQSSVPVLTKFAKENKMEIAAIFNESAKKAEISPAELWTNKKLRNYLARKAENILRSRRGMRVLKDFNVGE